MHTKHVKRKRLVHLYLLFNLLDWLVSGEAVDSFPRRIFIHPFFFMFLSQSHSRDFQLVLSWVLGSTPSPPTFTEPFHSLRAEWHGIRAEEAMGTAFKADGSGDAQTWVPVSALSRPSLWTSGNVIPRVPAHKMGRLRVGSTLEGWEDSMRQCTSSRYPRPGIRKLTDKDSVNATFRWWR